MSEIFSDLRKAWENTRLAHYATEVGYMTGLIDRPNPPLPQSTAISLSPGTYYPPAFRDGQPVPLIGYQQVPDLFVPKPRSADDFDFMVQRSWVKNRDDTANEDLAARGGPLSRQFSAADRHAALYAIPEVRDFLLRARALSPAEQLEAVNTFVNDRVAYVSDNFTASSIVRDNRGGETYLPSFDEFRTAADTLASRRGDCDDYAIAKYDLLAALGFREDKMHIVCGGVQMTPPTGDGPMQATGGPDTFVYHGAQYGMHAVLVVDGGQGNSFLLNNDRGTNIIEDNAGLDQYRQETGVPYFIPIMSVNATGRAAFTTDSPDDPIHGLKNLLGIPDATGTATYFARPNAPQN